MLLHIRRNTTKETKGGNSDRGFPYVLNILIIHVGLIRRRNIRLRMNGFHIFHFFLSLALIILMLVYITRLIPSTFEFYDNIPYPCVLRTQLVTFHDTVHIVPPRNITCFVNKSSARKPVLSVYHTYEKFFVFIFYLYIITLSSILLFGFAKWVS